MAKSAPARHFSTKCRVSVSSSDERGCRSGNAATPTQKSPEDFSSSTSCCAWARPSGCATQGAFGSPGGSPRSARTLRTPTLANQPMTLRSSATEWLTAVRWATGFSWVCSAIAPATWTVPSRVDPPAPYVTETKVGLSCSSRRMASQNCRDPWSVFGAKNSNENDWPACSASVMRGLGVRTRRCASWGACDVGCCRGLGGMCLSITQWSSFCDATTSSGHRADRKPGHAGGQDTPEAGHGGNGSRRKKRAPAAPAGRREHARQRGRRGRPRYRGGRFLEGQGLSAAVDLGATAGVERRDRGAGERLVRGEQPAECFDVAEPAVEQHGQRSRQALDDLRAVDEGGRDGALTARPVDGDELAVTEELLHPADGEAEPGGYLGE